MRRTHRLLFGAHVFAGALIVVFVLTGLVGGCASSGGGEAAPGADARRLRPDHAPTPFTAGEIRAACQPGRADVHRIEAPGKPPAHQSMRFVGGTSSTANFEMTLLDAAREPVRPTRPVSAPWVELQGHASFPEAQTEVFEERIEVPAGTFDCWVYEVTTSGGVETFHFAKELPGPPVRMEQRVGGAVEMRMTLIETTGATSR